MKKLLLLILLLPFLAKAQVPAVNDTTLITGSSPYTPQFRYVIYQGYRIPYMNNPLFSKYDFLVTGKYARAFYAPINGGAGYLQNQFTSAQAGAGFWSAGNGQVQGGFRAVGSITSDTFISSPGGFGTGSNNWSVSQSNSLIVQRNYDFAGGAWYSLTFLRDGSGTFILGKLDGTSYGSTLKINGTLRLRYPASGASTDSLLSYNATTGDVRRQAPLTSTLAGFVPYTGATTNVNLGTNTLTASNLRATAVTTGASGDSLLVKKADNLIYKRPYADFLTPAQAAAIYAVINGGNTFTGDQVVNKPSGVNYYSVQAGTLGNFTGGNAAGYTGRAVSDLGGYYNPFIIQQYQAGTSAVFEINAGSNSGNYPMLFKAGSFNLGTIGNNVWNDNDLNRQKGLLNVFSTDGISAGQTDIFAGDLFAMPVGTQIRYCATSTTNAPTTAAGWVEQYYRDTNIRGLRYRDILGNVWLNTTTAYPTWGAWVQVSTSSGSGVYALQSTAINTGYGINGGGDLSTTRNILADTTSTTGLVSKPNLSNALALYPRSTRSLTIFGNTQDLSSNRTFTAANLTPTDGTLTFSGTYNGNTARTIGLNLSNANTWTPTISGTGPGLTVSPTTTATANNQVLTGLLINPTFNNGGFTGVVNTPLRMVWNTSSMFSISDIVAPGTITLHANSSPTTSNYFFRSDNADVMLNAPASTGNLFLRVNNITYGRFFTSTGNLALQNGGTYTDNGARLQVGGTINSTALTASQAVLTDASKNLVSVATTGTGSVVRQNTPDFTGGAFNIFSGANNTIFSANSGGNYSINLPGASGTLALTSQLTQVVEITGTTQTASIGTIYIPHNASLTTITLPSTTAIGSLVQVIGEGAGGWKIAQLAGQQIVGVGVSTTVGTGGSIASTNANCTLTLRLTNTNKWTITSSQGTLTPL